MQEEKFWMQDPSVLITNIRLFPVSCMSFDEKLNALTRLAIIGSIAMYVAKYENWLYFLLGSLLVIGFAKIGSQKEGFSLDPIPTFQDNSLGQTYLNPQFVEEWPAVLPDRDEDYIPLDDNTQQHDLFVGFEEPPREGRPHAQYFTRTNLLPSDEYNVLNTSLPSTLKVDGSDNGSDNTNQVIRSNQNRGPWTANQGGNAQAARDYANTAFTRNTIAFRDSMTSLFKKKLNRRFRQSCNDTFSPFNSY